MPDLVGKIWVIYASGIVFFPKQLDKPMLKIDGHRGFYWEEMGDTGTGGHRNWGVNQKTKRS